MSQSNQVVKEFGRMESGSVEITTKASGTVATAAVTINSSVGTITTEALTAATGAAESLFTVTCDKCEADSLIVFQTKTYGGAVTSIPIVRTYVPSAGSFTVVVANSGVVSLNALAVIDFVIL